MAQPIMDYESSAQMSEAQGTLLARAACRRMVRIATAAVLVAVFLANTMLVFLAKHGGFGIILFAAPIMNGVMILASFLLYPRLQAVTEGASLSTYIATAILAPLAAIFFDVVCVLSMDFSMC